MLGATAEEVVVREGTEFSTSVRLGKVEKLQQASFRKLWARIFYDRRAAVSATSDFSLEVLNQVDRERRAGVSRGRDHHRRRPERHVDKH